MQGRFLFLLFSQVIVFICLIGRLFYLQVIEHSYYKTLSDHNRIRTRFIPPYRGDILDAIGNPLAFSIPHYRLLLRTHSGAILQDLFHIQMILKMSKEEIDVIKDSFYTRKYHKDQPLLIKDNLLFGDICKLSIQTPFLSELIIEKSYQRIYTSSQSLVHFLGYVGMPSRKDLDRGILPQELIGKSGLEKSCYDQLVGHYGIEEVEVNAKGVFQRTIRIIYPTFSPSIQLSIDLRLQQEIDHILEPFRAAACVVVKAKTGDIVAFVSKPGYNANLFKNGILHKDWKELLNHPDKPLLNRLSMGSYSPGSTFKMIVALAALDKGVIQSHTSFYCPGYYDVGSHRFHCWAHKKGGHGYVSSIKDALAKSCDVYFYHVSMMAGFEAIIQMAKKFGLSKETGVNIPQRLGHLPSKKKSPGHVLNIAIGQGDILSTPLQLVRMMCALSNGGYLVPLHFTPEKITSVYLGLSKKHLDTIKDGLYSCVNEVGGTAFSSKINDYVFGGKTGTTQVKRITHQQRLVGQTQHIAYEHKDHALFVGMGPMADPEFCVCVIVEHGESGAKVAAPIAQKIFNFLKNN